MRGGVIAAVLVWFGWIAVVPCVDENPRFKRWTEAGGGYRHFAPRVVWGCL